MAAATRRWPGLLAGFFGLAMALALSKFGNPVIFKSMESTPSDIWELLLANWPAGWGYYMIAGLAFLSFGADWRRASVLPISIVVLLGSWLFLVGLSTTHSVAPDLSRLTMMHFGATATMFFFAVTFLPSLREAQTFFRVV